MAALLPKDHYGLKALEQALSAQALQGWLAGVHYGKVHVFYPKFKMMEKFELAEELKALGMREAFGGQADFSRMDGLRDLYIAHVIHKAFVEVNEEGTEAAAATAVVTRMMGMAHHAGPPVPVFRADHPFLFLIRDLHSGAILFLGRVADPKA
jgi:serpin B